MDRRPREDSSVAASRAPVRRAAVAATLAYSTRDSEPWRIVLRPDACELHADPGRWLAARDPFGRSLTLSIGAALLNARASLAADGITHDVVRIPEPANPYHLATLTVGAPTGPGGPATDARLADWGRRGLARHRLDPDRVRPIGDDELELLDRAVATTGASLHPVAADVVVVCTKADGAVHWLTAGEAVQMLVLEAATHGLAVAEVIDDRALSMPRGRLVQQLRGAGHPQVVLRLGAGTAGVRGRRRSLADVLVARPQDW